MTVFYNMADFVYRLLPTSNPINTFLSLGGFRNSGWIRRDWPASAYSR